MRAGATGGRTGGSGVALRHRGRTLVDYDETGLRTIIPEEPDVTSPNTGLRRSALVVLAVGAALGVSACGGGQISQTANQVAAVDGGYGTVGDVHVNDFRVELPENGGEAKVGFAVAFTGSGFGEPISIERVEVDGQQVQIEGDEPLERGCTFVASLEDEAPEVPEDESFCVTHGSATLPSADDLVVSNSVPATLTFSNGDELEIPVGVVAETPEPGEYTRPAETAAPAEGH